MLTFLLALTCLLSADSLTGNVVKVTDGDTITVLVDNQQVKVRLSEIDAPEHGQDYGEKSKDALADLIFGKEVRVVTHGKDRYGRTIGHVSNRLGFGGGAAVRRQLFLLLNDN
jgi:endonuclease YncB( thermonuclease family)